MDNSATLSIVIDSKSPVPKYAQLQQQIDLLIRNGRLQSEQKLPSSREWVDVLGISRTSVLKAIDNLIAEGVLISRPKQGVFVAKHQPISAHSSLPNRGSGYSQINQSVVPEHSTHLVFDSGADTNVFPNHLWAKCLKHAWQNVDPQIMKGVMEGVFDGGVPSLKQQICRYLQELRGLSCSPSQITVTSGNRDSLSIILHALITSTSHSVYLEQACYPQIPSLLRFLNIDAVSLKLDDQGAVQPQSIPQQQNVAILTPCRQYPLGTTMTSERRQSWLDLITERQNTGQPFWIIEDDYDNEFIYQGRAAVPLMQQDTSSSVFFVGSFSKVLFRGLRLGFIVSPENQIDNILTSQKALGVSCSSALQPALAEFISTGHFASHLRKMRRHYVAKRDHLLSRLTPLSKFFYWENLNGGMHICIRLKPPYHYLEDKILIEAKYLGVRLNPLSKHYLSTEKQYGFVLGFTQLSHDKLEIAMDKLELAVKRAC
jgi:GntR family transcriptional regulator/MocR family aminotransferase